jgi:hypothetical protein
MATSPRTKDNMYPLIDAYLSSGLTQQAFCASNGVSVPVLGYWLGKYRRDRSAEPAFIELRTESAADDRPVMEVLYPSGVRLRFYALVPPSYIKHAVAERS